MIDNLSQLVATKSSIFKKKYKSSTFLIKQTNSGISLNNIHGDFLCPLTDDEYTEFEQTPGIIDTIIKKGYTQINVSYDSFIKLESQTDECIAEIFIPIDYPTGIIYDIWSDDTKVFIRVSKDNNISYMFSEHSFSEYSTLNKINYVFVDNVISNMIDNAQLPEYKFMVEKIISHNLSREESQHAAKKVLESILTSFYNAEKTDNILNNILRKTQYLYFLGLLEAVVVTPKALISILNAVMNSGKTHIFTTLFPIIFDMAKKYNIPIDSIFIGAYKKEIIQQYMGDICSIKSLTHLGQLFYDDSSNRELVIVVEQQTYNMLHATKQIPNNILIMLDSTFPTWKKIYGKNKQYDLLVMDNLHSLSATISPKKYYNMCEIFSGRNTLALLDEAHHGLGFAPDDIFTYLSVYGYSNESYQATIYKSVIDFPYFNTTVAVTGTTTIVHEMSKEAFRSVKDLIVKSEIVDYSKKGEVKYSDSIDYRLNTLFYEYKKKETKYKDRKITAYIDIPVDNIHTNSEYWVNEILNYAKKYGYTSENFLWHYSNYSEPMMSTKEVVKLLDDYDSEVKFVVVKNAFSAGINIKSLCYMTTLNVGIPNSVKKISAFHNKIQRLMRLPRFYTKIESNAKCFSELKTQKGIDLNTVLYILPTDYKPVIKVMAEKYLDLKEL